MVNPLEVGLAFLEGLALIASPCILPVLPLILSTSLSSDKSRPYGIIVGFILSFSAFALGSASLVRSFHLNLDILKELSLGLLALFGLMLLIKPLAHWIERKTQPLAEKGNVQISASHGFISGLLIGGLIGLVWTPCAGPILAAALVQIIRQENALNSFLLVVAFAIGVGIPMLIIALTGRQWISKAQFFIKHADGLRNLLGILILISVAYLGFGQNISLDFPKSDKQLTQDNEQLIDPLPVPYAAPEFTGIEDWINTKPLTMASLKGKVVLIDFWTYSCINCIRTLPYLTSWDSKYRDAGLVIVGVHSPEFEFEKKIDNIQLAVTRFGIHYPVAVDNTLSTWEAFHNLYWPAHYLIDKEGNVVYTHFGEGNYEKTENNIRTLLKANKNIALTPESIQWQLGMQTPETYLGYFRFENFANINNFERDVVKNYDFPSELPLNQWALKGEWKIEGQKAIAQNAQSALRLHFRAKKVYLVMGSNNNQPLAVKVLLNGKEVTADAGSDAKSGSVHVDAHRLYELIIQSQTAPGILEIQATEGLEVYAFTFGGS